jgi:glycosyltransferase involved in cell wall biosynthesis
MRKVIAASNLVNSIAPDILLLNHCALIHYALPLIRTVTRPVAVLHSDDKRFYKTASLFEKRIFRWIAPTRGVAERCKTYLQKEQRERVRIIPHGIDNKLFTVNKNKRRTISGNICFVGFIAENKGADLLPDIFNRVSKAYKNAHLTIVGYGPLEQTLKRRCEANGIIHKCIFTGAVNREKVAAILRDSDILLLPTRIEGFGLSIAEAMMSGAVPIVSRIKGVTDDIVSDGITGLLIEPDDTKGFADAIAGLLKNPEKLISMSKAARETAMDRYSAATMLDAYEKLFAEDDDKMAMPRRGTFGWIAETIGEKVKTGMSRQWLLDRAKEIWKQTGLKNNGGRRQGTLDSNG